jgi:hypothetical protein
MAWLFLITTLEELFAKEVFDAIADRAYANLAKEREASILDIVRWAGGIRDMIERHPAHWSFGTWDGGVQFPAVWRGQHLVREAEYA